MSGAPLLLSVFSTFGVGGPQVRFAAIANHFAGRFRHVILAMDGDFACRERLSPSLEVAYWPLEPRKGRSFANRRDFRRILRAINPDCLVTYNWGAIEWALANLPRIVRHVHVEDGFGPEEAKRQLSRRVWARRILLRNSSVIVPSRQLERLAREVWWLRPQNVRYIPNGIDCARFAAAARETRVLDRDRPVIGTVAALREEKNLIRLLDAFRLVRADRPCRLVICGDGPERANLVQHAATLGIADDVTFSGHRDDVESVYREFDIFDLSSDTEQMPTSVIEAMAAGLPIASTDVGDVGAMVAPQNQRFVVAADARSLAQTIADLLGNEEARREIGAANQARALSEFSQDRMFAAYGAMFDEAMA
jgi:glycosyltransferase involved in cell wall biosynthesis